MVEQVLDGVATSDASFGTSLVAARSFCTGEVLLRELPRFTLAESPSDDVKAAVVATMGERAAAGEIGNLIAGVLDLWLRSDALGRKSLCEEFFCIPDACSSGMAEFVHALVVKLVAACERLQACCSSEVDISQLTAVLLSWLLASHTLANDGTALFRVGHRANHSCDPNAAYHADALTGMLVYSALRPIAAGEEICFSYLHAHELLMPASLRRQMLLGRKRFECACERCVAADRDDAAPVPPEHLTERALSGDDVEAAHAELSAMPQWHGHWVWAAALWGAGISRLRAGVERGDSVKLEAGLPLLHAYATWTSTHHPARPHYVAAQFAEVYACLAALANASDEPAARARAHALASTLCAPYLVALEAEFGADDAHNVAMRSLFRTVCGHCGAPAVSRCARCRIVGYCGALCQKAAWAAHKGGCVAPPAKPTCVPCS